MSVPARRALDVCRASQDFGTHLLHAFEAFSSRPLPQDADAHIATVDARAPSILDALSHLGPQSEIPMAWENIMYGAIGEVESWLRIRNELLRVRSCNPAYLQALRDAMPMKTRIVRGWELAVERGVTEPVEPDEDAGVAYA